MRMLLTGQKNLELQNSTKPEPREGFKLLKVQIVVCRTDAKMWNEGHRDLVLPRVPGKIKSCGNRYSGKAVRRMAWNKLRCVWILP